MANQEKYSNMLAVGTILHDTFRIDRYLASGGFGNTYVATNVNFDETYAVKEFFMKGVNQRNGDSVTVSVSNYDNRHAFEQQRMKFRKEAIRLRKLKNPHIVRVHDLFDENGTSYYVMDFIDGVSLRDKLKADGHPMAESDVLDILRQVLDALEAVHKMKIYHLDLKPANIMLTKDKVAIVIDFGASKQLNSDDEASTSTGVSYTNGYAPTEQMERNLENMGPWTDFYALGATLYNMLTAEKPPMPSDILYDETPDKHNSLPMPDSVSKPMRELVLWLMQGNRHKRPQTVQEIYDYLDKASDDSVDTELVEEPVELLEPDKEETVWTEPNVVVDSPQPAGNTASESQKKVEVKKEVEVKKKSHPWIRLIAIAVIAAVLVIIGSLLIRGGRNTANEANINVADSDTTVQTVPEPKPTVETKEVTDFKYSTKLNTYLWTGTITDSVPTGEGTAKFLNPKTQKPDGRIYVGAMVKGLMETNEGNFKFANGDTYKGSFADDHFSKGKITLAADGSYFVGKFDSGGQPASGKWYDKHGNLIQTI